MVAAFSKQSRDPIGQKQKRNKYKQLIAECFVAFVVFKEDIHTRRQAFDLLLSDFFVFLELALG